MPYYASMRSAPVATAIPLAICFLPSISLGQVPSKEMAQAMANYGAKVAASAIFVSGRTLESVLEQEFAPARPLEAMLNPLLKFHVDRESLKVTCTLDQARASAQMLPSLGCTLLHQPLNIHVPRARIPRRVATALIARTMRRAPRRAPRPSRQSRYAAPDLRRAGRGARRRLHARAWPRP